MPINFTTDSNRYFWFEICWKTIITIMLMHLRWVFSKIFNPFTAGPSNELYSRSDKLSNLANYVYFVIPGNHTLN